ncbi:DUF4326 domain-containing protein [Aliiroseovarius lamellibrachiae]|uniref:DUF4326 domain-containing protein n=1 Tax=Aliiroseovarius lamellibrachiae TaxID=1924933 RepID=UPI001BE0CFC0|nr:DUF4326 domain-containing protein [Aliiroseovarius lamellibrachiae]MBT2130088.1 DUF4326 domain-containing protein [Aliiroseovarius lamellibrachiae]
MTDHPKRIQRKRTKGWRKPEDAVIVDRTSKFGNPWTIEGTRTSGHIGTDEKMRSLCVSFFTNAMQRGLPVVQTHLDHLEELRGKDLVCWCPLDQPCHADALLELANTPHLANIDDVLT